MLSKYLFSSTTSATAARHDDDNSPLAAANNNNQDGESASVVAEDFSLPINTSLYDVSPAAVAETSSNNQNREVSPPPPLSLSLSSADKDTSSPPPKPDYLIHGVEKSFLNQVAYGRNFTNPQQVYKTLIQILERDEQDQFDATRDVIVFEHHLKTGGTSLSLVLEKLAGGPESEDIMPGSHGSGWFKFNLYQEHIQQLQQQKQQLAVNTSSSSNNNTKVVEDWWQNLKTVYSHTKINHINNIQESRLEKFLKSKIPSTVDKRFRLVTMIRDPLPYLASNMNEWACNGDSRLRLAIPTLDEQTKVVVKDDPCYNISWTESYDIFIENYVNPYCNKNITEQQRQQQLLGNGWTNKVNCTKVQRGEEHMADCQSIPIFMTSQRYNVSLHNSRKDYVPEAYNKYVKGSHNNNNISINAEAISQIEIQALERLGGLSAQGSIYMMWHGITERMVESMCLFHSIVQFPYYETPHRRNKECRPTSYFTQQDKAKLRDFEILDYAVSRAAHAILDIRMAKLCRQLLLHTTKNNNNETNPVHQSLPFDACCSNFAFDSEGRIQNHTLSIIH